MNDVRGGHCLTLELLGGHRLMQEQHRAIAVPGAAGRGKPGERRRPWWSATLQRVRSLELAYRVTYVSNKVCIIHTARDPRASVVYILYLGMVHIYVTL